MRMDNIFKPCLYDVYIDSTGTPYFIYLCRNFLYLKTLSQTNFLLRIPFHNCYSPMLVRHNHILILTYVEKSIDANYYFRFLFPLNNGFHFSPDLKYSHKPSYTLSVLENELLLTIVCCKKISLCHLKFNPCNNTYTLKKLPFWQE